MNITDLPNMPAAPDTGTTTKIFDDTATTNILGGPYNVILFNDDHHAFDDVVLQVIKAVKCDPQRAISITMEAHANGQAIAFSGHKEACEHVESLLSGPPLRLATDIQKA